jgi:hypothetical protein
VDGRDKHGHDGSLNTRFFCSIDAQDILHSLRRAQYRALTTILEFLEFK